jgi:hypothetical protein
MNALQSKDDLDVIPGYQGMPVMMPNCQYNS